MSQLQAATELPQDYMQSLNDLNLNPLWPSLRGLLPEGEPVHSSVASRWRYADIPGGKRVVHSRHRQGSHSELLRCILPM